MYSSNATQVSSFEAKTHLSQILARVQLGTRIVITKHNAPIAMIVPFSSITKETDIDTIENILLERKNTLLGDDLDIQDLKNKGRR